MRVLPKSRGSPACTNDEPPSSRFPPTDPQGCLLRFRNVEEGDEAGITLGTVQKLLDKCETKAVGGAIREGGEERFTGGSG